MGDIFGRMTLMPRLLGAGARPRCFRRAIVPRFGGEGGQGLGHSPDLADPDGDPLAGDGPPAAVAVPTPEPQRQVRAAVELGGGQPKFFALSPRERRQSLALILGRRGGGGNDVAGSNVHGVSPGAGAGYRVGVGVSRPWLWVRRGSAATDGVAEADPIASGSDLDPKSSRPASRRSANVSA